MGQHREIDELIREIKILPIQLNSKIENEEEIDIRYFIDKIQHLLELLGTLPENDILTYKGLVQEYCTNISELVDKMREKQKIIRNEISLLDIRMKAQKAYIT